MKMFSYNKRDWGDVILAGIAVMLFIILIPTFVLFVLVIVQLISEVLTKGINFCA